MKKRSYSKINRKITLTIIFFSIIILVGFFSLFLSIHHKSTKFFKTTQINLFKEILLKENYSIRNYIIYQLKNANEKAKKELKKYVYDAYSITKSIYLNNKKKGIPDDVIKITIKETLRGLKFRNGIEYYFIQNINGIVEMNAAFPEFEGKNIKQFKDKNGKYFVKEVIKKALLNDEGFVEYYWKYKNGKLKRKICFVKIFRPYNWIIGMTIFYENFYNSLKKDILKKIAQTVLPSKVSLLIIDKKNNIIFKKNIPDDVSLNITYNKFKNNTFKTFSLHNNIHISYTTEIQNINWKIISLAHLKDIKKIIEASDKYFSNEIFKIFVIFFILLVVFLGFIILYFSKINKKFVENFNRLKNSIISASKIENFKNHDYEFKELQIISDIFSKIIYEIKTERSITHKISENIDSGIIFINPDMKIEYINSTGLRILGYKKEEVLGKLIKEIIKGVDIETRKIITSDNCEIKKIFAGKRYAKKRLYYTRKDNSLVPVDVSYIALMNNNNLEKIIIAFKDISEQLKREIELIEAKKIAEAATEAKSQFLANMSHEIRTPLTAIIGFVDLLVESKNLTEKQIRYLNIIKESSYNLMNIINDVLDYSKLERKKIEYEIRDFSIKELIIECVNIFKFKAKEKKIELNYSIDDNIPNIVKGDKYRISQVINNLISNAIKFTQQGSVSIKVELVELKENKTKIKFSVSDTGIGIPEDKLDKIFDAFSQAETSTTRKFGGTGLGLAICKSIIEQLGGKLMVESKEGKGTTFYFTIDFPLGDEIIVSSPKPMEKESFENIKILVVEDDIFNQNFLKEMFKKVNSNVDIASNGKEALNLLNIKDFDIVLMDIEMPELNGIETVKIIRKLERGEKVDNFENLFKKLYNNHIKIIALTGHDDEEFKNIIFDVGFDDYIIKPIDFNELLKKIYSTIQLKVERFSKLINIEELKELIGDNKEALENLKKYFLTSMENLLIKLEIAIKNKDFESIYKIGHTIKGTAGNIRANLIMDIGKAIEIAAKNKNLPEIISFFKELKEMLNLEKN